MCKNHKLLLNVIPIIILTVMCFNEVSSNNNNSCNNGLRTVTLWSHFTNGFLRIDNTGKRVIASEGNSTCTKSCNKLHMITVPQHQHNVAIFDPRVKKFICWNNRFSKAVPKKNLKIENCLFEEVISPNHSSSLTQYRSKIKETGHYATLQFNKHGKFFTNAMRKKWNRMYNNKLDKQRNRLLFSSEFIADIIKPCDPKEVCDSMRNVLMAEIHKTRHLLHKVKKICASYG